MAIIRKPMSMDEDEPKLYGGGVRAGGAVGSAAPVAGAPGAGAAPSSPGGPSSAPGSNFINLQDYLKANEGYGKKLTDQVAGSVERAGEFAKNYNPNYVGGKTGMALKQDPLSLNAKNQKLPDTDVMGYAREAEEGAKLAQTEGGR